MTLSALDGPLVSVGWEAGIGSPTASAPGGLGSGPYVSGQTENPDAGPNVFYAGSALKDMRYRYQEGGGALQNGGYPNQAVGYLGQNPFQTIDLVPSTIAAANIAALQAPVSGVALALVAVSGAGITVLPAAIETLALGETVPGGTLQIDAEPGYQGYGTSEAIQVWDCAACGRALSLTSVADLSAIHFVASGLDMYGQPQTERITGPSGNTVNGKKGFKWIFSITPDGTSGSNVSVGTADIFEFPLRADKWSQVEVYWDNALITASAGFVAADTATPSALTGSTRGTYAVQSASDGVKALQVRQVISPQNIATQTGVFGRTPA